MKLIALALLSLLASCATSTTVERLPAFDVCVASAPTKIAHPKIVTSTALGPMRELVPYVIISGLLASNGDGRMRHLWSQAVAFRPDVVVYSEGSAVNTGSTSMHVGMGLWSTQADFKIPAYAVCCRVSPSVFPFRGNDESMVLTVDDAARESGLLEGDTLLSVDGIPLDSSSRGWHSPLAVKRAGLKPGDQVKLVWIRPGTGRMEGVVAMLPNPRTFSSLPDATDTSDYSIVANGAAGWKAQRRADDSPF